MNLFILFFNCAFRSVLLADSFKINDAGYIEVDPFEDHSDDLMNTDSEKWETEERSATTWNMDNVVPFKSVEKLSVDEDELPVENWD